MILLYMTAKITTKLNKKQKQKQKQKQSIVVNINLDSKAIKNPLGLSKKQSAKSEPQNIRPSIAEPLRTLKGYQQLPPPVHKVYTSPIHNLEPQIFSGGVQTKQPSLADQINTYLQSLNIPQNTITPSVMQQASHPIVRIKRGRGPNKPKPVADVISTPITTVGKPYYSDDDISSRNILSQKRPFIGNHPSSVDMPEFSPKVPSPFDKEEKTILKASQPDTEANEPSPIFNQPAPSETPYEQLTSPSVFQQFTEPPTETTVYGTKFKRKPKIKKSSKKQSSITEYLDPDEE